MHVLPCAERWCAAVESVCGQNENAQVETREDESRDPAGEGDNWRVERQSACVCLCVFVCSCCARSTEESGHGKAGLARARDGVCACVV